jgi:hypothetical protein
MPRAVYGWITGFAAGLFAFWLGAAAASQSPAWPWDNSLDAVAAAPDSHRVLFENEAVRVLAVEVGPGEKEPEHTHESPSVMIVYQPTRIRYFGANGEPELESPEGPRPASAREPKWMEPEGLHAVENIDTMPFKAYRIELKDRTNAP